MFTSLEIRSIVCWNHEIVCGELNRSPRICPDASLYSIKVRSGETVITIPDLFMAQNPVRVSPA
jgi:hypothetical protein